MRRVRFVTLLIALPTALLLGNPVGAAFTQGYRGRIVAKGTGAPILGAVSFTCDGTGCPNSTPATAAGKYKNATDATTLTAVFASGWGMFVPGTYGPGGKTLLGFDYAGAAPVVVNPGAVASGINFKLSVGGGIKVHVQDGAGNPIANIGVEPLWKADGRQSGFASGTDPSGNIELDGVMPGKNLLSTFDDTGTWAPTTVGPVVVVANSVTSPVVITLSPASASGARRPTHTIVMRTARGIEFAF